MGVLVCLVCRAQCPGYSNAKHQYIYFYLELLFIHKSTYSQCHSGPNISSQASITQHAVFS